MEEAPVRILLVVFLIALTGAANAGDIEAKVNAALAEGGFPPIFMSFVASGHDLANRFVEDDRVRLVSFTGSTWVGRDVGKRVAERFGRSILELGGDNAIILDQEHIV